VNRRILASAWIAAAVASVAIGFGLFAVRLSIEGEKAMQASDHEFDQGRLRESLIHARRAAKLSAPGLRHVERANARLDAIATGAEATERPDVAILAWQSIRTIELGRHSASQQPTSRLRLANQRLATLLADDGRRGSMIETQHASRQVLTALERVPSRHTWTKIPAFVCTVVGVASLLRGVDGRQHGRVWFWVGAALASVGAVVWAILLPLS